MNLRITYLNMVQIFLINFLFKHIATEDSEDDEKSSESSEQNLTP